MVTEKSPLLPNHIVVNVPKRSDEDDYGKTRGLTLEELMPFEDDPKWKIFRRISLAIFWISLVFLFTTACTLSVLQHGACPVRRGFNSNGTVISILSLGNHTLSVTGIRQSLGLQ